MKDNNKNKATIILLFFGIGYFISRAFKATLLGGIISSICGAALIGGFADWFGVTAIFKKPLGINWPRRIFRTDILRNSKEKFIFTIRDMVQNELLNIEKINEKINNYNFYSDIWKLVDLSDEKVFFDMCDKVRKNIDESFEVKKLIREFGDKAIDDDKFVELVIKAARVMLNSDFYDNILQFGADEGLSIAQGERFNSFTFSIAKEVVESYKSKKGEDNLSDKFLYSFALNPDTILASIKRKAIKYLEEIKDKQSVKRLELDNKIKKLLLKVDKDEELRSSIAALRKSGINNLASVISDENSEKAYLKLKSYIFKGLKTLSENEDAENKVNKFIRSILCKFAKSKHGEIGKLIEESLNRYDEDEIIKLAEDKAGDDLQIIRINGSLVGGLIGAVIFLISLI